MTKPPTEPAQRLPEPSERDMQTARELMSREIATYRLSAYSDDSELGFETGRKAAAAIARALSQARQEERERCAGIAEAAAKDAHGFNYREEEACLAVARAIRAGEERGA